MAALVMSGAWSGFLSFMVARRASWLYIRGAGGLSRPMGATDMNADTLTMEDVNNRKRARCVAQLARRPAKALHAAIRLIELLTFKNAGFGFPNERITPPMSCGSGEPVDPTTFIVTTTRPYFDSWVAPELNAVVGLSDKFAAESFDELRDWCSEALRMQRMTNGDDR